jgi:carboxyl-terminal processing protease
MGMTLEEAVERMRGKAGEPIHIGVSRDSVEGVKHFNIDREIIKIEAVKSQLIDENYLFIRLTQFQKESASSIVKAIKKHRKEAKKNGSLEGIILDLRSNPGGLLDEAVNVSSIFLSDGVVVSTEGRDKEDKDIRYVSKTGHKELDIPLVVLINGASASASEIVAGAIQDHNRGLIMGTQTFGKGSVQTVAKVEEMKGVKLTIAQYMTPSGKKIQAFGIVPDVEVPEVEEAWIEDAMKERRYIRERDLRNHLTATVETKEEKKERLEREKKERKDRAKKLQKLRKEKKSGKEEEFVKFDPVTDYQVRQAIRFINGYEVFQRLNDE